MPHANFGNYIVARPSHINGWHSEIVIFGGGHSFIMPGHFSLLWEAYVDHHNGAKPKCILLYSWNLPCSCCTDVIIRSLEDQPYNETSVIVAHTTYWRREDESDYRKNIEKLKNENIHVEHVP